MGFSIPKGAFRAQKPVLLLILMVVGMLEIVLAEGTAQLIPAGSSSDCVSYVQGNDGSGKEGSTLGRPRSDFIYVHIEDPTQEVIYYGFTRRLPSSQEVYYFILAPDSTVLCTGKVASSTSDSGYVADNGVEAYVGPQQIGGATGYDALMCTPTVAGDYMILFNVGNNTHPTTSPKYYIHPFDVTVAQVSDTTDPVAINGRLFSYKWHLNTNSSNNEACMEFYTWTPDSLVVRMEMNAIRPYGYTVSFNSHGATNTGDIEADRRSTQTVSDAVPEYAVFLNEPDATVYPTGTPGEIAYIDVEGCERDSNFCIWVNATRVGEINVFIDLNGNGQYDEGTIDRYFPYHTDAIGDVCIPWDGYDGLGHIVPSGTRGLVIVEFLAGVVHYPVYDPENHPNGFTCAIVRPIGYTPLMYYDNRETSIGTYDLAGCSSYCNTWTGSKGDKVMVNTWLNTITSSDSDSFYVSGLCPPKVNDDESCTMDGLSLSVAILANDSDSDNELDVSSVAITAVSDPDMTYSFDESSQLLHITPSDAEITVMTLDYQVCDNTPDSLGGALCRTGTVTVTQDNSCAQARILPQHAWHLHASVRGSDVYLDWQIETPEPIVRLEVLRAVESSGPFGQLALLANQVLNTAHFIDEGVTHTSWETAYYRLNAHFMSGESALSHPVSVRLSGDSSLALQVWQNPSESILNLRYLSGSPAWIRITDVLGREYYQAPLHPTWRMRTQQVSMEGWTPGLYYLSAYQDDWRIQTHIFRVHP